MNPIHRLRDLAMVVVVALALLNACRTQPLVQRPMEFNQAIRVLANHLFNQLKKDQGLLGLGGLAKINIVLAPFVDAHSGEVVKVGTDIEQIMMSELRSRSNALTIDKMSGGNLAAANYILVGTISLDNYAAAAQGQKRYRVSSSIVERQSREIVANGGVWVSETDLDYTPTPLYADSPMFPKDRRHGSLVSIAKSPAGRYADPEYYDSLEVNALLVEADTAYESKNYEEALSLYKKAAERQDGQVMKTYIGLYKARIKLDDMSGAEDAYSRLVAIGVDNNNLSAKFLFSVDSTEFIADPALRSQYQLWVRQISKYFAENSRCVDVIGHSSHTGSAAYNDRLSMARAQRIRQLMKPNFPTVSQRSKALGKGFRENLVGSGTDDARDAVDRRVEFAVAECP